MPNTFSWVAVPFGILVFLIITGLLSALGVQLEKVPLAEFQVFRMEVSLSMILADIVALLAAIAGTSRLMEKKIEH